MNKQGSIFLAIFFAFFIFIFGILFINFLIPDIDLARTSLSCTDSTISDGTKLMCLFTDGALILYIWAIISISGGMLLDRFAP